MNMLAERWRENTIILTKILISISTIPVKFQTLRVIPSKFTMHQHSNKSFQWTHILSIPVPHFQASANSLIRCRNTFFANIYRYMSKRLIRAIRPLSPMEIFSFWECSRSSGLCSNRCLKRTPNVLSNNICVCIWNSLRPKKARFMRFSLALTNRASWTLTFWEVSI